MGPTPCRLSGSAHVRACTTCKIKANLDDKKGLPLGFSSCDQLKYKMGNSIFTLKDFKNAKNRNSLYLLTFNVSIFI